MFTTCATKKKAMRIQRRVVARGSVISVVSPLIDGYLIVWMTK